MGIKRQYLLAEMDAAFSRGDVEHCELLIEDMYALLDVEFAAVGRSSFERTQVQQQSRRATPFGEMVMPIDRAA